MSTAHCELGCFNCTLSFCLCHVPQGAAHRCEDESIDELAAFLGVGEEVAAMTTK